jgi:hypothetical protein
MKSQQAGYKSRHAMSKMKVIFNISNSKFPQAISSISTDCISLFRILLFYVHENVRDKQQDWPQTLYDTSDVHRLILLHLFVTGNLTDWQVPLFFYDKFSLLLHLQRVVDILESEFMTILFQILMNFFSRYLRWHIALHQRPLCIPSKMKIQN